MIGIKRLFSRRAISFIVITGSLSILAAIGIKGIKLAFPQNSQACGRCHSMEKYVDSYERGRTLDSLHRQAGVECTGCHGETWSHRASNLRMALLPLKADLERKKNLQTGLERRVFDEKMCIRCHISMERQANRTDLLFRNPHKSHWNELRCNNCHVAHGNQIDFCGRCHDNGGQRMTGGVRSTPVAAQTNSNPQQ